MSRVTNDHLLKQLHWRYACQKFDSTKIIREADWSVLIETLRLTPSSYNIQPWKFIVVQNKELRQQLFENSYKQSPVIDASHFVVLTYKEKMDEAHIDKHIEQMIKLRGGDASTYERYRRGAVRDLVTGPLSQSIHHWAQKQCYIAMGTFLTTASLMEIDALPMEGINTAGYDKVLQLDGSGYKSVAAIAAGYRHPDDKYITIPKVRFDAEDVIVTK